MTQSIYGNALQMLEKEKQFLLSQTELIRRDISQRCGEDPVEHVTARIKSDKSMREKCRRKGLPENTESALVHIHDAVGLRIVCAFIHDVYLMRDELMGVSQLELFSEKDYIRHAKPNGYRSLHLVFRHDGIFSEVQLRTISMDTWAALEHQMRYKQTIGGNLELIEEELKRCADELASTDISMQAIRDMIRGTV